MVKSFTDIGALAYEDRNKKGGNAFAQAVNAPEPEEPVSKASFYKYKAELLNGINAPETEREIYVSSAPQKIMEISTEIW